MSMTSKERAQMASLLRSVGLEEDAKQGQVRHVRVTMGLAGAVHAITLPAGSRGFRLKPVGNPCRFAVDENPGALAASSATPVPASAWGVGGWAVADVWEVRLVESTATEVRLVSETASLVVDVEAF